jgi:hypothetical protein
LFYQAERVTELPLVKAPAGRVATRRYFRELDFHEITLSNGMRVAYKCTHFQGECAGVGGNGISADQTHVLVHVLVLSRFGHRVKVVRC